MLPDLANERQLAVLLVTDNLSVVSAIAVVIAVMRHGEIAESSVRQKIFSDPQHAYTRELRLSLSGADGFQEVSE